MFRKHVRKELSAYCHNELAIEDSRRVSEHLLECRNCRKEFEEIKLGISLAEHLPRLSAPASLWSEIELLLNEHPGKTPESSKPRFPLLPGRYRLATIGAALLLVLGFGSVWYYMRASRDSWQVMRLEGAPLVGSTRIHRDGRLTVGEWLETDNISRARIEVANIGQVEIDPDTRVRLVETNSKEHRLALAQGRIHAMIWAPPRLFFVDTPSAVVVDYGCAYTLEVDEAGGSLLHVTSGWVSLVLNGREAMVPAGALCETRPGIGPGTPYFEDASEAFRQALAKLDFENGGREALSAVLAGARPRDALTLWYLLPRVNFADRSLVYDRLAALVAPPEGVTRDGVLRLDERMLDLWKEEIE